MRCRAGLLTFLFNRILHLQGLKNKSIGEVRTKSEKLWTHISWSKHCLDSFSMLLRSLSPFLLSKCLLIKNLRTIWNIWDLIFLPTNIASACELDIKRWPENNGDNLVHWDFNLHALHDSSGGSVFFCVYWMDGYRRDSHFHTFHTSSGW